VKSVRSLSDVCQYLAARLAVMGMSIVDVEPNLKLGGFVGRQLHRLDRRHRRRACQALAMAFPELSEAEVNRIAERAFEHFIQLVVEMVFSTRLIHPDSWSQRIVLDDSLQPGIEMFNAGEPAVFVTGHVGNWEVLGNILATLGYPMQAVARPLDNPMINDWVLTLREMRGMRIITKWKATDRLVAALERGESLGFIADQNAGARGLFVPFFNRLASTYKSIALLAVTRRVPVVCGYAYRIAHSYRYRFSLTDIIHPHEWDEREDPIFYVTARYMHAIEQMVRHCPHQYLWMHRRWKSRPLHERKGRPMPDSLRRKLLELEWVDQARLEQLERPITASF